MRKPFDSNAWQSVRQCLTMRIHLLQATRQTRCRSSKDTNGGYGTLNDFGSGLVPRALTLLKSHVSSFPELAPAQLAAVLQSTGHTVTYGDNLANPEADMTLLQSSLAHHSAELRWARHLRREYPRMRIGFFGGPAGVLSEHLLQAADFVIDGEVENAVLEQDIRHLDGLVHAGLVAELDRLPTPDWSHQLTGKHHRYRLLGPGSHTRVAPMLASRGCPMSCRHYCTYPLSQGITHRQRSVAHIIAEVADLHRRYGVRLVLFRDPYFTLNRARAKEIADALQASRLPVRYIIETHPRSLDEPLVRALADSGCIAIQLGLESGNPAVMHAAHRSGIQLDQQASVIRLCERYGIRVFGLFILAYYTDTRDTIEQTIDYAIRLDPYAAQFTVATPYPGTPWYAELASQPDRHGLSDDFDRYTQYQLVYRHPTLSYDEVEALKGRAYQRFYGRVAYWLNVAKQRSR